MLKCEIRADNTLHIEGYVNAVERDSKPVMVPSLGRCVEQVRAGVFGAALAENPDVELLENHDHSRKLGSTSDGVLTLSEDSIGLRASADISDPDMITKARTGQLKGWSFGFVTTSSEVENRADNIPRRVVTGMKLSEVSLIDGRYTPCYAGTLVEVRAIDNNAEMVEFRADEGIEIVDNSSEENAPEPDYSYYERAMQLLELRYNPYHDPSNGRFCSGGGGGGGGVLVVEKGQKGKGVYVFDRDIDSEYEEWQKSKSNLDKTISRLKNSGIEYNDVKTLDTPLTSDEIVAKISGGDMTKGSCASVAFAYIGNEAGYDVRDYRGGSSQEYFSKTMNLTEIAINCGGTVYKDKNAIKSTVDTLKLEVKEGKNYYLAVGQHAAIVRKNGGKYEYLELQSRNSENNGFKELNTKTLHDRFGAKRSRTRYGYKMDQTGIIIESSKLANNSDFKKMLGYINTSENAQMKGKSGNVK